MHEIDGVIRGRRRGVEERGVELGVPLRRDQLYTWGS